MTTFICTKNFLHNSYQMKYLIWFRFVPIIILLSLSTRVVSADDLVRTVRLDIESQALDTALLTFSAQAEVQVMVSAKALQGLRTEGVSGYITIEAGLDTLLKGTGLKYRAMGNTVTVTEASGFLNTATEPIRPLAVAQAETSKEMTASPTKIRAKTTEAQRNVIEEITVTARKREESLQDTPISITAFSGDELESRGITRLDRIQDYAPNVVFQNYTNQGGATNNASMYIRGIGQNDFVPTTEPGVGLYIDGVYFGRTVGSTLDLIDIERVEVLRGPQGTLFGRNTIGGAISITTRKPDEQFGAKAKVTLGTDDKLNLQGSVNVPLADDFFMSLSVASLNQDGYVTRTFDNKDLGDKDSITGRAAFVWRPAGNLELNLALDYAKDRDNGAPNTLVGATFDPGSFTFLNNVLPFLPCGASPLNPTGNVNNPTCFNSQYFLNDQEQNAGTAEILSDNDIWGVSGNITWNVFDWLDVKSITAVRRLDSHFGHDLDASPVPLGETQDTLKQDQISQEFQFLGNALDDKLHWILGFYYFQEDGSNINTVDFITIGVRSGGEFDNDSLAVFAQGTYEFNDKLSLTAGLRYTEETKRFLPDQFVTNPALAGVPVGTRLLPFVEVETEANEVTPMVNLSYHWTDELMIYATYSEGFKGGGFHQRIFPPLPETPRFDPEFVKSYEAGFKYVSPNKRFRLNGAGFYSDYEDIQITVFTAIAPVTDNAGNATIAGFELEAEWMPAPTWLLSGTIGYLDAEYNEIDVSTGLTGDERLPRVSDWTLSAGLSKEFSLGEYGLFKPRIDWSYRSKFFFDAFNLPFVEQKGYHLLNASAFWESNTGRYSLIAGIDNLLDEEYLLTGNFQPGFGWATNLFAREREWFITARVSY